MAKIYNLARMTTATSGTGTITLGSAVSGYLTLALAGVTSGDVISYGIKDGANSEVGYGVATDTAGTWTLTRNVTKSTNSNNAISLSGTAEVFTTIRAEDTLNISPPQGRLTLQTATPVMTTTQSAKTTIYYTPYVGQFVPLYDGSSFAMVNTGGEISVATTDTAKNPAAIGASKVNDWFIWNDAGTIRLSHGPDWTSDTARSAGTALIMVNGISLNNASITNGPAASRGTYVGTTRSNASSQLDWIIGGVGANGTAGLYGVWNAYNRVHVKTMVGDSTDSWQYLTANTWRAANNSATMRVSFVFGLNEDGVSAQYNGLGLAQSTFAVAVGIGLDSTTAFTGSTGRSTDANNYSNMFANYSGMPGIGYHYVSALEYNTGSVSNGFFVGDLGLSYMQTGLHVELMM